MKHQMGLQIMKHETATHILNSPDFKLLMRKRRRVARPLVFLILASYFGFILTVAFSPATLGQKVGGGVASLGIYVGIGLLFLSFIINGVYIKFISGDIRKLLVKIRSQAK